MMEEEREALLERAAIMEYDGGLDRRTATLAAAALRYSADYQAMLETVKAYPDSETILYEFLEKFLKPTDKISETKSESDAPEVHSTRQGLEALQYMTGCGIPLIGVYQSGAMIAEQKPENFTANPAELADLMAGKGDRQGRAKGTSITRFYFIPKNAGLLCLDIDRKNGKDGIKEFYAWTERIGKPRHLLPRFLQDIPTTFPCCVSTPSGGYHLYFRYSGAFISKRTLAPDTPAVEVKHGTPGLTSPGSYKDDKPYILHGELENAPALPAFIIAAIQPPKPKAVVYIPQPQAKKEWGKPSWDRIREWTEKDGTGSGRNDRAFHLARHARDHGYTETETLAAMRGEPGLDGLPEKEMQSAVESAFKRRTA